MKSFVALCLFVAVAVARTAYFCEIAFETTSTSPAFQGSYDLEDFNAITFGSFKSNSGDTEGRLAVRDNLDVTTYSVGYETRSGGLFPWDASRAYALVVGGNMKFNGGAYYPQGNAVPYQGAKETILVGGNTAGTPSYIAADVTAGDASSLTSDFGSAQAYFNGVSNTFNAMTPTGNVVVQYGGAKLVCGGSGLTANVFSVDASALAGASYWEVDSSCVADAQYIINIVGTGAVTLPNDSPSISTLKIERVVYNVVNSGTSRPVSVTGSVVGSVLAPGSTFSQPTGVTRGFLITADVLASNQINRLHCQPPADVVPECTSFESGCAGLAFTLAGNQMNFQEFNAISFGSFRAVTGDVEGRLAVRRDVNLGAGYSVGAELRTSQSGPNKHQAFSLVVGGNLVFVSGNIFPDGSGIPYAGAREDAYVAGNSSTSADLAPRVTQGSDITSVFDAAQGCYRGFTSTLAQLSDNVSKNIQWSALQLTCADNTAAQYVVSLTGTEFSQFTYTVLSGCNYQARWVINVRGTDAVTLTGDSFPLIPSATIYNVVEASVVNVHDTRVSGHLLAPNSILNQANGVIVGKVVAADIVFSLQINHAITCEEDIPALFTMQASQSASAGSYSVRVRGADMFRVGDRTSAGVIVRIDGDLITLDTPLAQAAAPGSVVATLRVSSSAGRGQVANPADNSASAAGLAIATFAVAALLI